jgi:hypothetical protein
MARSPLRFVQQWQSLELVQKRKSSSDLRLLLASLCGKPI